MISSNWKPAIKRLLGHFPEGPRIAEKEDSMIAVLSTGKFCSRRFASKEATEPEQEHTCDITEYHEEGGTTYNKMPKIAGKHCSHCEEQMRITFARPAHICKKTWHGWERDGEGGRSGRKGDCNRPYLFVIFATISSL